MDLPQSLFLRRKVELYVCPSGIIPAPQTQAACMGQHQKNAAQGAPSGRGRTRDQEERWWLGGGIHFAKGLYCILYLHYIIPSYLNVAILLFRCYRQNPMRPPTLPLHHVHGMYYPLLLTECRTGKDDEKSRPLYGKGEDVLHMELWP